MNQCQCPECVKERQAESLLSWPAVFIAWRYEDYTIWIWHDHTASWDRQLEDEEIIQIMNHPENSVLYLQKLEAEIRQMI